MTPRRRKREQPAPQHRKLLLRGRIWIESSGGAGTNGMALTDAGVDLLEQIEATGSLSEAARRLRFSYRRAWMLIDAMNRRWPSPLVTTAVGGRRGGGTHVTELGSIVVRSYRDLQIRLQHLLDEEQTAFARIVRPSMGRP